MEEMTTVELRNEIKRDPVVILPVGATEAHGPHLPLGTDSFQPEAIANMLAARIGGLVAPPIKYGHHSSTRNMVGTIAISFDTLRALVREVMESMIQDGIRKIVVLSGHAGHVHLAALKVAAEEVVRENDVRVMLLTDYDLAWEVSKEMGFEDDGHGGMVETSRIMAIAADLVREGAGRGEFVDQEFMVVPNPEICFPHGYSGPAEEASRELGRRINEHVVNRLEDIIRRRMGV
jgi:creatinine amidohydrolase